METFSPHEDKLFKRIQELTYSAECLYWSVEEWTDAKHDARDDLFECAALNAAQWLLEQ